MNVLIFGAGYWGKCCKKAIEKHAAWAFKGFLDNAEISFMEDGVSVPVFRPEDGIRQPYDKIIISNSKSEQISEIKAQLRSYGVSEEKMDVLFENKDLLISAMANINSYDEERDPRVIWLRDYQTVNAANEARDLRRRRGRKAAYAADCVRVYRRGALRTGGLPARRLKRSACSLQLL